MGPKGIGRSEGRQTQEMTICTIPFNDCGGWNDDPPHKDVHVSFSRNCEYDPLHHKRDFAAVIMCRILRWGENSVGPKCHHKGPCKRETGGLESEREDIIMEAEVREERDRKRLRSWL